MKERLTRQLPLLGERGLGIIRSTVLAIVGVGGNGSMMALHSAYLGFTKLLLVDHDVVETSNLNRLVTGGMADVGRFKVEVTRERLETIAREIDCRAVADRVQSPDGAEALVSADVVVSAVDDDGARRFLQEHCSQHGKILLDVGSGVVIRHGMVRMMGARASLYWPGGACLFHQTLEDEPMVQSRVSFITPNAIICAVGLEMLLTRLTGLGEPRNLAFHDSLRKETVSLLVQGDPHCSFCQGAGHARAS